MPLSESDTRAKLVDPAIHARGWTEDFIDYTLRVKVHDETQPVAVALIEAKGREIAEALATLRRPS